MSDPKPDLTFLKADAIELNKEYPVVGTIRAILAETPNSVTVLVNNNLKLTLKVNDIEQVNIVKEKAFEAGVFLATITKINKDIEPPIDLKGVTNATEFPLEAEGAVAVFKRRAQYDC